MDKHIKRQPGSKKPAQKPAQRPAAKPEQDGENVLQRLVREDPEKAAQLLRDILSRK